MKNSFILISWFVIISCEKGEIPIPPHVSGDDITNSVEMGETYHNQIFFSLYKNQVISSNLKTDWDLAFEASDTGWHVRLNTAKGMAVTKTNGTFLSIIDTIGACWSWDAHNGNIDSTAIGNWQEYSGIYIIDLGYNQTGIHQGLAKFQILSVSTSEYQINYSDLSETIPSSKMIVKQNDYSFSYFSFLSGELVTIAPPKTEWDLLFTQYTHIFDGQTPYLVTGVLLNPHNTQASLVDYLDYSEINYESATNFNYSDNANTIGYNWKFFDYSEGIYHVNPNQNFVIKNQNGLYYKLHFIDFYNEQGVKGFPKFEFKRL